VFQETRRRLSVPWLLLTGLALLLLWSSGCEEDKVPQAPEPGPSVEIAAVEATPTLLAPGDTTVLRARVVYRDGGGPAVGLPVLFGEIAGKDWGDFLKTSTLTDSAGWASTRYVPRNIQKGQVGIRVESEGVIAYVTIQVDEDLATQDPTRPIITLTASETTLPADGASQLTLTVSVQQGGEPLAGQVVRLTAGELFEDQDHDGRWSAGDVLLIDSNGNLTWDAIGTVTDSVVTGAEGTAMATYTAGEQVGPVYIKATLGEVSKDLEITLHATGTVLQASVMPSELPADGMSQASVTVVATDPMGAPLAGKLVRFAAGEPFEDVDGDGYFTPGTDTFVDTNGNGVWDAMGEITPWAQTDSEGQVEVTYTASHEVGTVTVTVSTRDASDQVTLVLMSLPPVASVEASWEEGTLWANGESQASLQLVFRDAQGRTIPGQTARLVLGERFEDVDGDGRFTPGVDQVLEDLVPNGTWDALGAVDSLVAADATGTATATLTAPETAGTIWLKVTAGAYQEDIPIPVQELPAVADMDLAATYPEITLRDSGGRDRTTVQALCYAPSGDPVPAGVKVTFRVLSGPGVLEGPGGQEVEELEAETLADGGAEVTLLAGNEPGTVRLQAATGSLAREIQVTVSVGPPAQLVLHPEDSEIGSWESTTIEATVRDAYNNPVRDGTVVFFSVDEGMIVGDGGNATATTSGGVATATYYSLAPVPGGDGWAEIVAWTEEGSVADTTRVAIPQADLVIQSLELEASRSEIGVQGAGSQEQCIVTATAVGLDGNAVGQGHTITFEIVAGPGGGESLEGQGSGPVAAATDPTGQARVSLYSGTKSGTVRIRAEADGGVSKEIVVAIAAGPPAGIECPPSLEAGCGADEPVPLTVFVHDLHHNPVRDGTVVHFQASEGLVMGADGLGSSQTSSGLAQAVFVPPYCSETGSATITVETYGGEVLCQFPVVLSCDPCGSGSLARLELSVDPSEIRVRETGGTEQAWITAVGYDDENVRVGAGHEVTFEILEGPGGGENLNGQGYGPVTVATDGNGEATVVLGSGTVSGTVLLKATSEDGTSQMALVAIAAGPPVHLSVGVDPCNLRGWDVVGATAEVVAIVSDVYNNPVPDGTRVWFTVDEGIIRGALTGELGSGETVDGVCRATYLSGQPRDDGQVTVTASTAGGTVVGSATFIVSGPPASLSFVSPTPPVSILADGDSEVEMWVEVLDVNGNYVVGGTQVEFLTDIGSVGGAATTADGCYGSLASDTYQSEVLGMDYSYSVPDDGIGAVATVVARAGLGGGASDVLQIQLLTGPAYKGNCQLEVDSDVSPSGMADITIVIKDRYGNPLGGHALEISAVGGGSVSPASVTTDAYGEASATFTAPADPGTVTIQVVDTDPNYGGITLTQEVTVQ
jgi:hypothetical protein